MLTPMPLVAALLAITLGHTSRAVNSNENAPSIPCRTEYVFVLDKDDQASHADEISNRQIQTLSRFRSHQTADVIQVVPHRFWDQTFAISHATKGVANKEAGRLPEILQPEQARSFLRQRRQKPGPGPRPFFESGRSGGYVAKSGDSRGQKANEYGHWHALAASFNALRRRASNNDPLLKASAAALALLNIAALATFTRSPCRPARVIGRLIYFVSGVGFAILLAAVIY